MFMCRKHWFMVPARMRDRIWATYRRGQCDDWQPSKEYCDTAKAAIIEVARKEGLTIDFRDPKLLLYDALETSN